jgi:hypothetical protein
MARFGETAKAGIKLPGSGHGGFLHGAGLMGATSPKGIAPFLPGG